MYVVLMTQSMYVLLMMESYYTLAVSVQLPFSPGLRAL